MIQVLPDESILPELAERGIFIRNLWHMLLYAWSSENFIDRFNVQTEPAPNLNVLLCSMLCRLMEQRFRVGLGRGYCNESLTLRGVRGLVDFAQSLKTLAFENGQAHCRFQVYTHNVPKNQIIRSTMARMIHLMEGGPHRYE